MMFVGGVSFAVQNIDNAVLNFNSGSLLALNVLIGLMMFGVALGINLSDFRALIETPKPAAIGLSAQFILLPLATFFLTLVLDLAPSVELGMILVASCPGGNLSNVMTYLGRGNAPLSVGMTAVSTAAAVVMTPPNFSLWGGLNPATKPILESVAINLLFSFLRPQAEPRIVRVLGDQWFVCCSSTVTPEVREYERGIATWLNASVGPVISRYLERLQHCLPRARIAVMQSAGTTISADQAAQQAVRLLLSGPAGGLAAARSVGKHTGHERLMSFDMGGTSTDVALIDGDLTLTNEGHIGGYPVAIPDRKSVV